MFSASTSNNISIMYGTDKCDEGIVCITYPEDFMAMSRRSSSSSLLSTSTAPATDPPASHSGITCSSTKSILHAAIQKHKFLLTKQIPSLWEIEEGIIGLYQSVRESSDSRCPFYKCIAENNIGQILYQNKKYHQAHLALERAAAHARFARQLHGNHPRLYFDVYLPVISNLGRVHYILGEYREALQCVIEALDHCPSPQDESSYEDHKTNLTAASLWYNLALLLKLHHKGQGETLYALNRAHHLMTSKNHDGSKFRDLVTVQVELCMSQLQPELADNDTKIYNLLLDLVCQRQALGYEHSTVAQTLCTLGRYHMDKNDYLYASNFYGEAVRICHKLKASKDIMLSPMAYLGKCYQELNCYQKAMDCFCQALRSRDGKPFDFESSDIQAILAMIFYNVGMIQFSPGNPVVNANSKAKAMQSFRLCLRLRRSCFGDNHPAIASVLHNMGILLSEQRQINKALLHFEESLSIRKATYGKDHYEVASSLRHIGRIHQDRGDYQKALEYSSEALAILRRCPYEHTTKHMIEVLVGLGQAQHSLSLMDQALKSYEEATILLRRGGGKEGENNDNSHIVNILKIMGNLAIDMSDMESARVFFAEAARLSGREEDCNIILNTIPPSAAAA